jgi:hypothetical protein
LALSVVEHERIDRRRVACARVLPGILLAGSDDIPQQLQQGPVVGPALVLKQQIDVQLAFAEGDPIDQIGAILAQILSATWVSGETSKVARSTASNGAAGKW